MALFFHSADIALSWMSVLAPVLSLLSFNRDFSLIVLIYNEMTA